MNRSRLENITPVKLRENSLQQTSIHFPAGGEAVGGAGDGDAGVGDAAGVAVGDAVGAGLPGFGRPL